MKYNRKKYTSLWYEKGVVKIIDQTILPEEFRIIDLRSSDDIIDAIKTMKVRGAPLIGVAGAYGVYFAFKEYGEDHERLNNKISALKNARPTAVNLQFAVDLIYDHALNTNCESPEEDALEKAKELFESEIKACKRIGEHGYSILNKLVVKDYINLLTHCNAGWLATVDYGTASAPVFEAAYRGLDIHVWVDETRPRNQGGKLTAWEYFHEDIPHTVITDNAGGHLMQNGEVDIVITGADRIASNGDSANKIGTYLKALAAYDNNIPFYIAAPISTIDFNTSSGKDIPIEIRHENEIKYSGNTPLIHTKSPAINHGFDITPARLITGYITEKGIFTAKQLKDLKNA
ncbi:MAG: S-methyl-5-thioribose-1-phosphate isomerase [Candidatus Delongbacteria bacterium]|jgi:methylthioribose-1-phosphate isomerase|nr:S-methyl-5-thioribose-1-phosphate isomerase [Candidatus Delongbacteria bacterium]